MKKYLFLVFAITLFISGLHAQQTYNVPNSNDGFCILTVSDGYSSQDSIENRLIIAKQTLILRKRQTFVIIMTAVFVIGLVSLLLLLVQQQKRRKIAENRELSAQLEQKKRIQQLEKDKQEELLDAKTREITSYSLLMANKNNVLQEVLDVHQQIYEGKKEVEESLKKLDIQIQNNFNLDEDWNKFKIHFEQVHPNFFGKLKDICGDLTEENLRFYAYFKLGLSTKEIAQILHIAPQSVFNLRHRLKKKLELSEETDFDTFIRNI